MTTDPIDAALAAWFEAAVGRESPDPAEFARARGLDPRRFRARLADARWLVARHAEAAATGTLPQPPCRLGEFELIEEVGRGGMGIVYRAIQSSLGRPVAIKVLDPHLTAGSRGRARFLQEARAAARLQHPHVVPVISVGEQQGLAWYAMEWIAGRSLAQAVQEPLGHRDPARHRETAAMIAKVAHALQHAHAQGLLHRDVKPGNILLDQRGEPHLADFGLVKELGAATLTASGEIVGSPAYMSPEQLDDARRLTPRSDVYSLGVTLYECLTRRRPHQATTVTALRREVAHAAFPLPRDIDPTVPLELQWICLRAMAPEPARRYPSAAALAADLEAYLRAEPVAAQPPSRWLGLQRSLRCHVRVLGLAAVAVGVTGAIWWFWSDAVVARAARERAQLWRELVDHRLWGSPAQLAELLERAVAHDAEEPAFRLLSLVAALRQRDPAAARAGIARLREIAPDPRTLRLADQVDAALRAVRREDPLPQDRELLELLAGEADPDATRMWLRGELLAVLHRWDACMERLRVARMLDPTLSPRLVSTLVDACLRTGAVVQAHDEMLGFARSSGRPDAWADAVRLAKVAGDRPLARRVLEEMRGRFPDDAWTDYAELCTLNPGDCTRDELDERLARAQSKGTAFAAIAPRFRKVLADLYRDSGDVQRSIEIWTELCSVEPSNHNLRAMLGSALLQQADAVQDPKLRAQGLEHLRQAALAADPYLLERDIQWGTYHYFAGSVEQAIAHFREAARLLPEHPRVWRNLAGACLRMAGDAGAAQARLGWLREGLDAQQHEVDLGRDDPRAWLLLVSQLEHLQRCLEELGDPEGTVVGERLDDARRHLAKLQRRR